MREDAAFSRPMTPLQTAYLEQQGSLFAAEMARYKRAVDAWSHAKSLVGAELGAPSNVELKTDLGPEGPALCWALE